MSSIKNVSYKNTSYFTKIVEDYLDNQLQLQPFYQHPCNLQGIEAAIKQQQNFSNRNLLLAHLESNYGNTTSAAQQLNISKLNNLNCFTITTAHQPNIFLGPLYFIYKILHTIQLSIFLNNVFNQNYFVPVYYMGSEDADLDELGNITLQQKKLSWQTTQTGAVGRMKVDTQFTQLINEIEGQLAVNEFGKELIDIFRSAYKNNKTIQEATFSLINSLFGKYGLLIVQPDNALLKAAFIPIIEKEINEQFSFKEVVETNNELSKYYKTQATAREINLFYLIDDKRQRIIKNGDLFTVEDLNITFTKTEIIKHIHQHHERFSPNVILRPLLQETILPNVVFIGGGGELAYWLQLKNVFQKAGVNYPVLMLRNSYLLLTTTQQKKLQAMSLKVEQLFTDTDSLINQFTKNNSTLNLSLLKEIEKLNELYDAVNNMAATVDATLSGHVKALQTKAIKKLQQLEKKMLQAEKKKFGSHIAQLKNIKISLFPNNSLQERVENFAYFYSVYGAALFDKILASNNGFINQFTCLAIDD